jgi:hypothetical protein
MMPMMKHRSEHMQPIRHWLGQPSEIKHGGSSPRAIRVDHPTRGGTQRKVFGQTVLVDDLLGAGAKQRFQVYRGREPVAFKSLGSPRLKRERSSFSPGFEPSRAFRLTPGHTWGTDTSSYSPMSVARFAMSACAP